MVKTRLMSLFPCLFSDKSLQSSHPHLDQDFNYWPLHILSSLRSLASPDILQKPFTCIPSKMKTSPDNGVQWVVTVIVVKWSNATKSSRCVCCMYLPNRHPSFTVHGYILDWSRCRCIYWGNYLQLNGCRTHHPNPTKANSLRISTSPQIPKRFLCRFERHQSGVYIC